MEKPLEVVGRRRENIDLSSYTFGKIPPQAKELEEAVLGAIMLEGNALSLVVDILKPESFYVNANKLVFEAIFSLFNEGKVIDLLTVTEKLRELGKLEDAGGAYYVTELTGRIASAAHIEHHARIIVQKFLQREIIRVSSDNIKTAYEDTTDVFDLLDNAENALFTVADANLRRSYEQISKLLSRALNEIEHIRNHQDQLSGIPTGFIDLDRLTGGWQKSDLIILAARPGMGKSAAAMALARNAAVDFGKPVALFSLEMSGIQLVNRLLSSEAEVDADKLKKGNIEDYEWDEMQRKADKLSEAPIFIDDTPAITIFEFKAKAKRLKAQYDIKLLIIDYLQLMTASTDGKTGNRQEEVGAISRALKSIAKELDIPIIALAQLSRAVETRGGDKRPQLSDLRESGSIEADADMVIFLYRAEYYGFEVDENNNPTRGIGELIVAKHRNGALRTVYVRFIDRFAKFVDTIENTTTTTTVNSSQGSNRYEVDRDSGEILEDGTPF